MHGCPSASGLCLLTLTFSGLLASLCLAQNAASPDYGFNFITIGDVNNPAYPGGSEFGNDVPEEFLRRRGVGSVSYEYRIAETEVTTAQWVEFINVVGAIDPVFAEHNLDPSPFWGGGRDRDYQGPGLRWKVGSSPIIDATLVPVGNVSWRAAAMYVNWLHSGKNTTPGAWLNGAYDTSTFTTNEDGTFNDQLTRSPDAQYWIPSEDEWLKAAHYDPNKNGAGLGGWWQYPYLTDDTAPITGMPGDPGAQTGAALVDDPLDGVFLWQQITLRSYPDARTAYGLLDVSGGTQEWTEFFGPPVGQIHREYEGTYSAMGDTDDATYDDLAWHPGGSASPGSSPPFVGLRVASAVQIPACPGDANIDGEVDFSDVTSVLGNWLGDGSGGGDSNADGLVDFADITSVLTNWQAACP